MRTASADPFAIAVGVAITPITTGGGSGVHATPFQIGLHQPAQILGQTDPFLGCGDFRGRMNFRVKSGFNVHCIVTS